MKNVDLIKKALSVIKPRKMRDGLLGDVGSALITDKNKIYLGVCAGVGSNTFCAEQNAIGVAAGLARAGKKPYVYSGSIFLSSRANEFIRDDVAYANLNVKLIGTGASGFLGFTHNWMGKENDLDLIKNMPNITHCNPTKRETLKKALLSNKPLYIRI